MSDNPHNTEPHTPTSIWLITANIVKERSYGHGGIEKRPGTKHFRGGAKVYIVGAYGGMCESVTVIGHHRSCGRYIKLDMRRRFLENLRMTLCYSPKVIEIVANIYSVQGKPCFQGIPSKGSWEHELSVILSWPNN